jgi:hypothetical protein
MTSTLGPEVEATATSIEAPGLFQYLDQSRYLRKTNSVLRMDKRHQDVQNLV